MIRQFNGNETKYKLPLADGTIWELSAAKSITPWLDNLAKIMQLEPLKSATADRKIFFLALNNQHQSPTPCPEWETIAQGTVYRIWSHSTIPELFIELNPEFIDHPEIKVINMWSSLKAIYRYYVEQKTGPIHAALASLNNQGILIAAAGGTGKSTCSSRFPAPWQALSDDNALIVKNSNSNQFYAHPMPTWSDHLWSEKFSTCNCSHAVPIKAIFFLEQAKQDGAMLLPPAIAIHKLFGSFKQIWENYFKKLPQPAKIAMSRNIFDATGEIVKAVPCYTLKATIDGNFWQVIESLL